MNNMQEVPILTDQGGKLSKTILMCAYGSVRCKHFGINDWHHFYCAAQDTYNKNPEPKVKAYPWLGAGKQLGDPKPDAGCPFVVLPLRIVNSQPLPS